jgi:hypothetical protein
MIQTKSGPRALPYLWDDSQPRYGFKTILEEWVKDNDLISLHDGSRTRFNRATRCTTPLRQGLLGSSSRFEDRTISHCSAR